VQVDEFVYLGVKLHAWKRLGEVAAAARLATARRALGGMRRRCGRAGITNAKAHCSLFDAVVRPAMSYGAEIWAPEFLQEEDIAAAGYEAAEVLHRAFLQRLLAVRGTTSNLMVLAEFGRFPIICQWARDVYSFWRRVRGMGENRYLVQAAVQDSMDLAVQQAAAGISVRQQSWAGQIRGFLRTLGLSDGSEGSAPLEEPQFVLRAMQQQYLQSFRSSSLPEVVLYRDAVRGGDSSMTGYGMQAYLAASLPVRHRAALARLRTSSHWLLFETGRWAPQRLERSQRVCRACHSGQVEDEAHMLFHCSHPELVRLRECFSFLFDSQEGEQYSLAQFLSQTAVGGVAAFVASCFSAVDYRRLPRVA
jgi:hypothetical protein